MGSGDVRHELSVRRTSRSWLLAGWEVLWRGAWRRFRECRECGLMFYFGCSGEAPLPVARRGVVRGAGIWANCSAQVRRIYHSDSQVPAAATIGSQAFLETGLRLFQDARRERGQRSKMLN